MALHEAINRGHYENAEALLASGHQHIDLRLPSFDGVSALHTALATKTGHDLVASCRVLCAFAPDVNARDSAGLTPLEVCALRHTKNPLACAEVANAHGGELLHDRVLTAVNAKGETLLQQFWAKKCYGAVAGMLSRNADQFALPEAWKSKPKKKNTEAPPLPLLFHQAIDLGVLELARPFIDNAIRMRAADSSIIDLCKAANHAGIHPALQAAQLTDPLVVRYWIEMFITYKTPLEQVRVPASVATNAKAGFTGETSLLLELVKRGHTQAALALWDYYCRMETPIDVDERDTLGRSLVFYATYRWRDNDRTPLLHLLLRAGANRETTDSYMITPLLAACRADNFRAAMMICNVPFVDVCDHPDYRWEADDLYSMLPSAHVNVIDNVGNSPLFYACMHDDIFLVDILTRMGANVDYVNPASSYGMSPLHLAARMSEYPNFRMIMLLLDRNANPRVTSLGQHPGNSVADYVFMREFLLKKRPMTTFFIENYGMSVFRAEIASLVERAQAYNWASKLKGVLCCV